MKLNVVLATLTLGGHALLIGACGNTATPQIFRAPATDSGDSIPASRTIEEGPLEPVLTPDGADTGINAPSNSNKQVFDALHLRPTEEVFDVVADASKTETVRELWQQPRTQSFLPADDAGG